MFAIIMMLAKTFGGSLLGFAERQLDRKWETMRDERRLRHKSELAQLRYRQARNQSIAAINNGDRGIAAWVRAGFALPFVVLTNLVVIHFLVVGEWYAGIDDMPLYMKGIMGAVLNFYLLFEGINVHGKHKTNRALIGNEKQSWQVHTDALSRAEQATGWIGSTRKSGPTGQ